MKWFIQDKKIHGPYSDDEVADIILNRVEPTHIWGRGLEEWVPAERWTPRLASSPPAENKTPASAAGNAQETRVAPVSSSPAASSEDKTVVTPSASSQALTQVGPSIATHNPASGTQLTRVEKTHISIPKNTRFKVQYDFIDQGDMTLDQLIEFTSKQQDHSKIAIFDPKSREWKEIYTIPEIVKKFGITRRKHARVPILAQFSGEIRATGEAISARVVTISVGGMGLSDNFSLTIGQNVRGQMTSPHFFSPITVDAEVTYSGQDGYVGLKFVHLGDDSLSLITEYVNKFSQKDKS